MNDYLPFIVIGIISGSAYGIAALGLVLTYKTSGVFNFGHGAIAAAAAVVFYELHYQRGIPWPIASAVSVLVFGVIAGLILERLSAALAEVGPAYRIVATTGLILVVPASFNLIYGPLARGFAPFLPTETVFTIQGVRLGYDGLITILLGLGSVAALYVFFRVSKLGVQMRAVVDRPELVDLTGQSPARIRRISWVIGSSFAAISGLLLASTQQQLDVILLSLLVVQAFGAAAFGAFRSLPLAYVGGVLLGVLQAVAGRATVDLPELRGLDQNMPFLFLFIGLLVIPRHKLVELGKAQGGSISKTRTMKRAVDPRILGTVVLGAAVLVPFVVGTRLPTWTSAMAAVPLFLSLGLLVFTSGQISLCHIGFAAIGATTLGHMLSNGVPWFLAVLIAGLVTIPVGALVAIPAIRLSGLYLALATLGFGILLAQFFYIKPFMFGLGNSLSTGRPGSFGMDSDKGYYYVLLGFALASIALVVAVERSRLGRLLRGMADSPAALSMLGTNTNLSRVLVFCISAFLAGISGALTAGLFGSINREPFNYVQSLVILSVLIISGRRTVPAAVIGVVLLVVPPAYLTGTHTADYFQLFFGLAAIFVAVSSGGRLSTHFARRAALHEARLVGPAGDRAPLPLTRLSPSRSA